MVGFFPSTGLTAWSCWCFNTGDQFQELKMHGLRASLLKINFNYKLAMKVKVWMKAGQSFSLYKCLCTVHNEDGLTVLWKALKHSELFAEIKGDFVRLIDRLNRNRIAANVKSKAREEDDKSTSLCQLWISLISTMKSKL
jgi:hypothetical protein